MTIRRVYVVLCSALVLLFSSVVLGHHPGHEYWVFEDASKQLTIDDIRRLDQENDLDLGRANDHADILFRPTTRGSVGMTESNVWLKISFTNTSAQAVTQILQFDATQLYAIYIYPEQANASIPVMRGGRSIPQADIIFADDHSAFPIPLNAHSTKTIYARIVPYFNANYQYQIHVNEQQYYQAAAQRNLISGALIALAITVLFVFTGLGVVFNRRIFFKYAAFATSSVFFQLATIRISGLGLRYPQIEWQGVIASNLVMFTLLIFVRHILNLKHQLPHWDRYLKVLQWVSLLLIPILVSGVFLAHLFLQKILVTVTMVSILLVAFHAIARRVAYAKYIFMGLVFYTAGAVALNQAIQGNWIIPQYRVWFQLGVLGEMAMFASLLLVQQYQRVVEAKRQMKDTVIALEESQSIGAIGSFSHNWTTDVIDCTDMFRQIYQFDNNTQIGFDDIAARFHPADKSLIMSTIETAKQTGKQTYLKARIVSREGTNRYIEAYFQYYVSNNTISGVIRDITELVEAERHAREQDALVAHQTRLAQQGEMLQMISHQWRQPLHLIGVQLHTIHRMMQKANIDNDEFDSHINKSLATVKYLSHTIDDFQAFFSQHKRVESCCLAELIRHTLSIISSRLEQQNICVLEEFEDVAAQSLSIMKSELQQVLLAVLNNAVDAFAHISGTKRLTVRVYRYQNAEVAIEIEDTASGIPENIMAYIFDPYFTTKTDVNGTGIGLYMSKMIMEKSLGGSISAKNIINTTNNKVSGAVFRLTFNTE